MKEKDPKIQSNEKKSDPEPAKVTHHSSVTTENNFNLNDTANLNKSSIEVAKYQSDFITFGMDHRITPRKIKRDIKDSKLSVLLKQNTGNVITHDTTLAGNILNYEGKTIDILHENGIPWFRAKDIATILEYKSTTKAITNNVDKSQTKPYRSFVFQPGDTHPIKNMAKYMDTVYITEKGLYELVLNSQAKSAKDFKKWVSHLLHDVNHGTDIYEDTGIVKDFEILPVGQYTDWALTHHSSELKSTRVFYIGVIGKVANVGFRADTNVNDNEIIFKYGITMDELRREKEHKANIETYTCFYVVECIKNDVLEKDIRYELERRQLVRHMKFNGKKYTELFTTSENFTIDNIMGFVSNWIKNNDYKVTNGFNEMELQCEKTKCEEIVLKQQIEITKQKELDVKQEELKLKRAECELKILKYQKK